MMIINASSIDDITRFARANGHEMEENYDLAQTDNPVILSTYSDPYGQVANTLVSKGIPVLYLALEPPTNLSSSVFVIQGAEIHFNSIEEWMEKVKTEQRQYAKIANLDVKFTTGVFSVKPGVGGETLARSIALQEAVSKRTLYIDLNYRYPKTPYLIGYRDPRFCLESLIETFQAGEKVDIMDFALHKSKVEAANKQFKEHFSNLPDNLYVLSPSGERGLDYFPEITEDLEKVTQFFKDLIDSAKRRFHQIVISMSSDPDEILNVAALRVCDTKLFCLDTNPASVKLFPQRIGMLQAIGVSTEDSKVVLTKVPEKFKDGEIEQLIQRPIEGRLPFDNMMIEALHQLKLTGSTQYQEAVKQLRSKIYGYPTEQETDKKEDKFFGKLFNKRVTAS